MTKVDIKFPFGGRSDRQAHHEQPAMTTRDAPNMRARDIVTGRIRGAQRPGFIKVFATQINSSGLGHDLCSITYDSGKTDYARKSSGSPSTEWLKQLPDTSSVEHGLDVDRQSDVYVTHGQSGVVKFNSAGEQQWKIALPVDDDQHLVRALHVDVALRIYVGVTEGGDQTTANLWCYEQLEDENEVQTRSILWTIRSGFYFEELQIVNDLLYTLQNDDVNARSYVIAYGAIDSTVPVEVLRVKVSYPARGLAVGSDGDIYVASPEDTSTATAAQTSMYNRGISSKFADFRPSVVGSDFKDLVTNYDLRVWSHYDVTMLTQNDVSGGLLEEGAEIVTMPDISGNGRDLIASPVTIPGATLSVSKGPALSFREVNAMPAAYFDGDAGWYINPSALPGTANRRSQKSMWPGYAAVASEAGAFVTFIVLKVPPESQLRGIMTQKDNGSNHLTIYANRNSAGSTVAGTISVNPVTVGTNTGAGSGGKPLHYDAEGASKGTSCMLITLLHDAGLNNGLGNTVTTSLLRVNGFPVDRWNSSDLDSRPGNHSTIGWDPQGVAGQSFVGAFCEMLTLDRIDPTSASEDLVIEHEKHPDVTPAAQSSNEMTDIEGRLMHKWGIPHLAPIHSDTYAHPYGLTALGSIKVASAPGATDAQKEIVKNFPLLAKYDRSGNLKWVYNSTTTGELAADAGGVGLGVRTQQLEDSDVKHVYSVGPPTHTNDATGEVGLRKVIDEGATFSDDLADDAWHHKFQGNSAPSGRLRMDVDKYGRLYFPYQVPSSSDDHALEVFELSPDGSGDAQLITYFQGAYVGQSGFAAHHDPAIPDYGEGQTINLAENVYLAMETQAANLEGLIRLGLVTATQTTGNARNVTNLVAANGDIKTFTVAGVVATPTGGSGALDLNSDFVMCVELLGEAVFLDGLSYKVYTARTGEVTDLSSKSSGAIVKRGRIGVYWRGRLVIGHFPENPGGYAMSAMGDIRDWDFFPPVVKSTSAVLGNLSRTKDTPAVLSGLVPMNEDLLLLGAYNSIWRMSGDPQDGGQMDRLSDSIGMAWGKAWAKDPEGHTFFFGLNPPGLYSITADGLVVNVTKNTLEDTEFASIDFTDKNIRLYWDPVERGIHIYQQPRTTLGVLVNHWFWEEKTEEMVRIPPIWTDTFKVAGVQPMAAGRLEGETVADRLFVVLGEDGYLRKVDAAAKDDDGNAIDAYFVSQVFGQQHGLEVMMNEVRLVLGAEQDGAELELFANDDSEDIGPVLQSMTLGPGVNHTMRKRVRGENIWIRVRNSRAGERFAYGSGHAVLLGAQLPRK